MDKNNTPVQKLGRISSNYIFMKREDMIPYSFGGNKARKAMLFFEEIVRGGYNCIVTYGSSHSNHCRVIANMAASRKLPCYIIQPDEASDMTFNSRMTELFGAHMEKVPVKDVHDTIEQRLRELKQQGKKPYFIPGGGHGDIGTQAYVLCYEEIREYEEKHDTRFGYIFLASGTGTTQAGLVCGQLLYGDERKIAGISIARKNPYGKEVIAESIRSYLSLKGFMLSEEVLQSRLIFLDDYTEDGYGMCSSGIFETIKSVMTDYGIPLDSTYTGKAFWGMEQYIVQKNIAEENILFIHTGGTPLYFHDIDRL